jgi:hypothetical protein
MPPCHQERKRASRRHRVLRLALFHSHHEAAQVLAAPDALTLLLTVESLLIAALAVAISLTGPKPAGGKPFVVKGGLVLLIAFAITIVAAGAAAAWFALYVDVGPSGVEQWVEAVSLAVGIVAGAAFAWGLWIGAK